MIVKHGSLKKKAGNPSFFLSDGAGGFFNSGEGEYSGLFAYFDDCYKILDKIEVPGVSWDELEYNSRYAQYSCSGQKLSIWLPIAGAIVCEFYEKASISPMLDGK